MAAAQHKLSRRALLAGACAGAGLALPLPRPSGLESDPGQSLVTVPADAWKTALARYTRAAAGLEAVAHTEDDDLYDGALGRHHRALERLLAAAAPDLAAAAEKLELIVRHSVFELSFGDASLAALREDLRRFAGR